MSTPTTETDKRHGRIWIETGAKRIRAYLGGEVVADTAHPVLVWEAPYYPTYYFPPADVHAQLLQTDGPAAHSPSRGDGQAFTVRAGGQEAPRAAVRYEGSPIEELRELIRLDWHAMDAWFEEDEQVFTHPRDPYTRMDILPSSRRVRVDVNGVTAQCFRAAHADVSAGRCREPAAARRCDEGHSRVGKGSAGCRVRRPRGWGWLLHSGAEARVKRPAHPWAWG